MRPRSLRWLSVLVLLGACEPGTFTAEDDDPGGGGDEAAVRAEFSSTVAPLLAQSCDACHTPPLFTNNEYFNIGLRPATDDAGRQSVSGAAEHAGDVKVPSLRNVGLRPRLMHTGEMPTLRASSTLVMRPLACSSFRMRQSVASRPARMGL